MPQVNYLATVVLAALSGFVLGGLWYSLLFAKVWMRLAGQSEELLKSGNRAVIFGGAFLLNLVAALVLAMVIAPVGLQSTAPWRASLLSACAGSRVSLGVKLSVRAPAASAFVWRSTAAFSRCNMPRDGRDHRRVQLTVGSGEGWRRPRRLPPHAA